MHDDVASRVLVIAPAGSLTPRCEGYIPEEPVRYMRASSAQE